MAAAPDGVKALDQLQEGDEILTGSFKNKKITWRPGTVAFSGGTDERSSQSSMVYIHFDHSKVVATPDQLFLLSTGELCRADRLVPGADKLLNASGDPINILAISMGEYNGGVHQVAAATAFHGDIDGHLLLWGGVVAGDFLLQTNAAQLIKNGLMRDSDKLPKIGTTEYEQKNKRLLKENFNVSAPMLPSNGNGGKATKLQAFYLPGDQVITIPPTAAAYLDEAQAKDVLDKAPRWDFDEAGINSDWVTYVLSIFSGLYPKINFYFDQANPATNAYAFNVGTDMYVVLCGGMARLKGLAQEGLSFILAHMVSASQRSAPQGDNSWTSVAMADYYSISILMNVYFGKDFGAMYMPGYRQLNDCIFKFISEQNSKYSGDPYHPTIDKRFDALDAGKAMDFPPDGIGGPTAGGLKVVGAKAYPPMVNAYSFIDVNITAEQSAAAYKDLAKNNVISYSGEIADSFNMNTDLDFLFPDVEDEDDREMMIGDVRSVLLQAGAVIALEFNTQVGDKSGSNAGNYSLTPKARVRSAQVQVNSPVVDIKANIRRGVEYEIKVGNNVTSSDGSTLDQQQNSAKFRLT